MAHTAAGWEPGAVAHVPSLHAAPRPGPATPPTCVAVAEQALGSTAPGWQPAGGLDLQRQTERQGQRSSKAGRQGQRTSIQQPTGPSVQARLAGQGSRRYAARPGQPLVMPKQQPTRRASTLKLCAEPASGLCIMPKCLSRQPAMCTSSAG